MRRYLILALLTMPLTACNDDDAQKDLDDSTVDGTPVNGEGINGVLYVNYDDFPNVVAWCDGTTRLYTTTRADDSIVAVSDASECVQVR